MKKSYFILISLFILTLLAASKRVSANETKRSVPQEHINLEIYDLSKKQTSDALNKKLPSQTDLGRPETSEDKQNTKEIDLETRKKFNKLSRTTPQIYTVTMRSDVVFKLQTALGYVSTIDLPEPALKVFIGDQELFKVGVYEREVLIKPITDYQDARTNLTIVTNSGRLTFDVSVGSPETADFVLDFRLRADDVFVENAYDKRIHEKEAVVQKEYQEKEKNLDQKAKNLADQKLKQDVAHNATTVMLRKHEEGGDIRVNLVSLSKIGEKMYLRFGVRNLSSAPYKISKAVIGLQTYGRKNLGLTKDPQGLSQFPTELEITNPVPAGSYVYGVLVFSPRALGKNEYPVFLLFEEDGKRNLKIERFKWIP